METLTEWIARQTARLEEERTARHAKVQEAALANMASNDYLGLSAHPRVVEAARGALTLRGLGSASARLMSGTYPEHATLEERLSEFFNCDCLLLSSGYLANVGLLSAVAGRGDVILADRLCHASVLDGCRLSGASLRRFHHNDLAHLEELLVREREGSPSKRVFVVSETLFSMDGDTAPVHELEALANRFEATLILDDAHALGVFQNGRGLASSAVSALRTGTLSKAFGAYGGIVLAPRAFHTFFESTMRPFLFNTSLPPAIVAGALAAVELVDAEPTLGEALLGRAERFRTWLVAGGCRVLDSQSQIVPVLTGSAERALALSDALGRKGILAPAIRTPTVPRGEERVRFSVCLSHSEELLDEVAGIVCRTWQELGEGR